MDSNSALGVGLDLKIALVCASNMNRSMEAHYVLHQHGFKQLFSFGTSTSVKLPGPSVDRPNVYSFGTPYKQIFEELSAKDRSLYTRNKVLMMLERNMKMKLAPEQWHTKKFDGFDLVFTFEERIFEATCTEILAKGRRSLEPVHVLNVHTTDNHEQAAEGAKHTLELCKLLAAAGEDWEERIEDILLSFDRKTEKPIVHSVFF